jgi:hypothetical protein
MPGLDDAQFGRQPHGTERGVTTELGQRTVPVEITDAVCLFGVAVEEDHAIRSHSTTTIADRADGICTFELTSGLRARVEEDEIVS